MESKLTNHASGVAHKVMRLKALNHIENLDIGNAGADSQEPRGRVEAGF
jgi:hypothetical protein